MRTKIFMFYVLGLFSLISYSQEQIPQSPSVSGLMSYESHPVDLYTGTPNVSIPIYTMPTRSKDISIGVGLSYHPSSVAVFRERSGDCGRGWTIFSGGVITGTSTGNKLGYYSYNFMGFSGAFEVMENSLGLGLIARVTENKNRIVKIKVNFTSLANHISEFIFFDDQGYQYVFSNSDSDTYIYVDEDDNHNNRIAAYHLSYIADNTGNGADTGKLVSFNYQNHQFHDNNYHNLGEYNNTKTLSSITVPGVGSIFYGIQYADPNNYNYTGVSIYNNKGQQVKRAIFDIGWLTPIEGDIQPRKLNRVVIKNTSSQAAEESIYELSYNNTLIPMGGGTWDGFGYLNRVSDYCEQSYSSDITATSGVLKKMTLPTGGSVIYNYELNTYSYEKGVRIDWKWDAQTGSMYIDPNHFLEYSDKNKHNFEKNYGASCYVNYDNPECEFTVTSTSTSFPPEPTYAYLKFTGTPYQLQVTETGPPTDFYPTFTINSYEFKKQNNYDNDANDCLGKRISVGTHTVTMSPTGDATGAPSGSVSVYLLERKPDAEIKKWYEGGGIRIKNIAYFKNSDVPSDYYTSTSAQENYQPVREITYDYTLFDDSSRSSGNLLVSYPELDHGDIFIPAPPYRLNTFHNEALVNYKNVTVHDTKDNGGYTRYTFFSSINDTIYDADAIEPIAKYKRDKLFKEAIYHANASLQQETLYSYDFESIESIGEDTPIDDGSPVLIVPDFGYSLLRQVNKKFYHPSGMIESIDNYSYYPNRKIDIHTTLSSRKTDTLKTKYYYHTLNSTYSQNRIQPEVIENYRNDELLSTTKINYAKDWVDPSTNDINISYLPSSTESAKGANALTPTLHFNKYDKYGHILEFEQEDGLKVAYVWGYQDSQIIAKIEGISSYADIDPTLLNAAKSATDSATTTEAEILTALDNLRNDPALAGTMITTYTHIPLVGVSTITDTRGYRTTYEYDINNRLKLVKDHEGNILSENEYHIKSQN